MNEFLREFLLPCFLTVSAICVAYGVIGYGVRYMECRGFANGTGIETRFDWGCYVKKDGKWVPVKYAFGDAHELRIQEKGGE